MLLNLQHGIVYGPVNSRRLGSSLGINILPANLKTCSFNCLYCQYGWTDYDRMDHRGSPFPTIAAVRREVKKHLSRLDPRPAFITLSGNGESTMHPEFPRMVKALDEVRREWSPKSSTAILSNASTVGREAVRRALAGLDVKILKFDAGDQKTLRAYNQPQTTLDIETIISGLEQVEGVILQSLFTAGARGNFKHLHLENWMDAVTRINPRMIQLYSLDRSAPSRSINRVPPNNLQQIQRDLKNRGIEAEVF